MVPIGVIVTIPPYAPFIAEVAQHPLVRGFRLNTVMPTREALPELLERLSSFKQPLWVDLKGRQLRVVGGAVPPYTAIPLSHPIDVPCPADAFFSDGREHARIAAIDGNSLILEDGPRRFIGPGESVNIVHPQLKIKGHLTETDQRYLNAMKHLGLKKVMLSFVEQASDTADVAALLPSAEIIQKIESIRGLEFARRTGKKHGSLMAARGDLYVEVGQPHLILNALRWVIAADDQAFVASRLFGSLARHPVPEAADIGDATMLLQLGYRRFMLGDEVCLRRDAVIGALNLLEALAATF